MLCCIQYVGKTVVPNYEKLNVKFKVRQHFAHFSCEFLALMTKITPHRGASIDVTDVTDAAKAALLLVLPLLLLLWRLLHLLKQRRVSCCGCTSKVSQHRQSTCCCCLLPASNVMLHLSFEFPLKFKIFFFFFFFSLSSKYCTYFSINSEKLSVFLVIYVPCCWRSISSYI